MTMRAKIPLATAFDWSRHARREAFDIPIPVASRYDKLVAANNEFIHPIVENLFVRFLAGFDAELVRHYADHQPATDKVSRHFGVSAGRVFLAAGSDAAIQLLIAAVGSASGRLVLQWPNYKPYETYARLSGVAINRVSTLGLGPNDAANRLLCAMEEGAPALVVVTNPSGIDGSSLPLALVSRLADVAHLRQHVLVIDEAYVGFSEVDHLPLLGRFENLVILRSFSKSMGLAGLRISAVLAGDVWLSDYLRRWQPGNPVSVVAGEFLCFCLDHLPEIEQARADIVACREWIRDRAKALLPGWQVPRSDANFVYLGAPGANDSAAAMQAFDDAGIAVRDMSRFQKDVCAVRVTVGHEPFSKRIVAVLEGMAAARPADGKASA